MLSEVVSPGNTLKYLRTQILAQHLTGASNGPTEAMNLLVKRTKCCRHGFTSFRNCAYASSCTAEESNGGHLSGHAALPSPDQRVSAKRR